MVIRLVRKLGERKDFWGYVPHQAWTTHMDFDLAISVAAVSSRQEMEPQRDNKNFRIIILHILRIKY